MDMKLIPEFPPGEPIVSMVEFKGRVLVATSFRVYQVVGDRLVALMIQQIPDPEPPRPRRANVVKLLPPA